jgi:autotransporter-associated beta strand protein
VRPNGTAPNLSVAYFNGGILQATASSADFIQSGAILQSGGLNLDSGAFDITLATQSLQEDGSSPGGGLTKLGSGTLTLSVGGTYNGPTIVSNGTLRIDGSIPGNVTVKSGATLGGNGSINGMVTVEAGGSLGAGSGIGTLTLSSSPVLNGSVVAELDRSGPLADVIAVGAPIAYHGTLVLTNAGAPLQAGDTFTLFNASSYSGSFTLVSQTPGQSVTWNTANLTVNGSISVASTSVLTPPTMTNSVSGNTISLSWPSAYLGWVLQLQTNSINTGISNNWADVPGSASSTSATVPINPANPTVFIRLRSP